MAEETHSFHTASTAQHSTAQTKRWNESFLPATKQNFILCDRNSRVLEAVEWSIDGMGGWGESVNKKNRFGNEQFSTETHEGELFVFGFHIRFGRKRRIVSSSGIKPVGGRHTRAPFDTWWKASKHKTRAFISRVVNLGWVNLIQQRINLGKALKNCWCLWRHSFHSWEDIKSSWKSFLHCSDMKKESAASSCPNESGDTKKCRALQPVKAHK